MSSARARRGLALCVVVFLASGTARAVGPASPPTFTSTGRHGVADRRAEMTFSQIASVPAALAIQPRVAPRPVPMRGSSRTALPRSAQSSRAQPGATSASVASPSPSSSFAALGDNNGAIPPDTNGAVGPTQIMTALNTQVRIQDRSSATVGSITSLNAFWSPSLGVISAFDPRTVYDQGSGRWIMVAADGKRGSSAALLLAVSKTTSASGGWYQWRVDLGSSGSWADFPRVGFNARWIVVQANILATGDDAYQNSAVWTFGKSTLYGGGLGNYTLFTDPVAATQVPAITFSSSLGTMYLVENWAGNAGGFGALRVSTITGPVGGETYTGGALFPQLTSPWADAPAGGADFAPQLGSSRRLQLNDSRINDVVWRNGTLWAAQTVFLPSSAPTRASVQWWQIGSRGEVVQWGRIDDASGARFYAYPSIAVNKRNDVLLGYSRFASSQYVSANYALRAGSDALGTMRADTVLKAGLAPYYKTGGGTHNRWGDYSASAVDPADDISMWTIQEYAAARSGGVDRWGTWWGKIIPPPQSGSPLVSVTPSPLPFGSFLVETSSAPLKVTVKNNGSAPFTVNGVSIGGANAGDFSKSSDPCTGQTLWPGMSCLVDVTFRPSATGTRSASLSVANTAAGSPHTIQMSGSGFTDAAPPVTSFRTQNGAISLGFPGQLFGESADDITGVSSVTVTWTSSNWTQSSTVTCDGNPLTCSWGAFNPIIPGTYIVRARARDAFGNQESPGPSITITVI